MNNKVSFYILFAFLFIAVSCKSEAKTSPPEVEKTEITQPKVEIEDSENNPEIKVDETDEVEKEIPNKIDPPKKDKQFNTSESTTKEVKTSKPKVDKGIEIEMGIEETESETEVKESEEVKKNNEAVVKETKVIEEENVEKPDKPNKPERVEKFVGVPKHTLLDGLLNTYVSSSGVVDYAGLKSKESKLDEYLSILENHPPGTTWSREQELAFWINAYNAYTIKLILKNYPLNSITDLHGGKPWDVKWINLDGKNLSLNNIENDIIRPKYNEPRIHFAVNCAAKSCPPILNGAYKSRSLESQLENQTKKFINNPAYNSLGKNDIEVSKIFDWYGDDFGNVASFVMRYANTTVKPNAKVSFREYDWSLNGK